MSTCGSNKRTSDDIKPNINQRSSESELPANTPSKKKQRLPGKSWSNEEILILFNIAIKQGASIKNFEGVVEGRTGKQCYDTFCNTIVPRFRKSLAGESRA